MLRKLLPTLAIIAFLWTPSQTLAQEDPLTLLNRAVNSHSIGDNFNALVDVMAAEEVLWNLSPMGVRKSLFVTDDQVDYGVYTPKIGNDFLGDEPIMIYCEPFGYTQIKDADGTYSFSIIATVSILDSSGQVIVEGLNMGPYSTVGHRSLIKEHMLLFTLNPRGLPQGSYVLKIELKDNNNPTKIVELSLDFTWLQDNEPEA